MTAQAMTLGAGMAAAQVQIPDASPLPPLPAVPKHFADYAYEYKLGLESAEDPHAVCPIQLSHIYASERRRAWFEARHTRRKQLGLKIRRLQPISVGKGVGR